MGSSDCTQRLLAVFTALPGNRLPGMLEYTVRPLPF
jgi:hypothetical protein